MNGSEWTREDWEWLERTYPASWVAAFKWRYEECLRGMAVSTDPWTVEEYAAKFSNVRRLLEKEKADAAHR